MDMSVRDTHRLHQIAEVVRSSLVAHMDAGPMAFESLDFAVARAVMDMPCDCWCCRREGANAE